MASEPLTVGAGGVRHSTPALTIGRYAHAQLHDVTAALNSLPSDSPPAGAAQAMRATGTDGKRQDGAQQQAHQSCSESLQFVATARELPSNAGGEEDSRQVLPLSSLSGSTRESAKQSKRGAARIRTGASRICNPLADSSNIQAGNDLGESTSERAARGAALGADLAALIDAWPTLPEALRAGILAMVRAAKPASG